MFRSHFIILISLFQESQINSYPIILVRIFTYILISYYLFFLKFRYYVTCSIRLCVPKFHFLILVLYWICSLHYSKLEICSTVNTSIVSKYSVVSHLSGSACIFSNSNPNRKIVIGVESPKISAIGLLHFRTAPNNNPLKWLSYHYHPNQKTSPNHKPNLKKTPKTRKKRMFTTHRHLWGEAPPSYFLLAVRRFVYFVYHHALYCLL